MTVSTELSTYKLDLVGVLEIRWGSRGAEPAGEYTFSYGKGNEIHVRGTGYFLHNNYISSYEG
jgi:hypothetical protein